jgi:DNA-binding transcriptional regulator YbjK
MEDFSVFDYASSVQMLEKSIIDMTNEINAIQSKITLIESASSYATATQNKRDALNAQKTKLDGHNSNMQAVLNEINNLLATTEEKKTSLYYFYTVLQVNKHEYMQRLLFNYTTALDNLTINQLLTDDATSTEVKTEVAKIIYEDFPIKSEYKFVISVAIL